MSYQIYKTNGYGICVSDLKEPTLKSITDIISVAPIYRKSILDEMNNKDNPTIDDVYELLEYEHIGIAEILAEVIQECENVELTACDDFDGKTYLVYEPYYPWNLPESDRNITQNTIERIIKKYVSMYTDESLEFDYQRVENGG